MLFANNVLVELNFALIQDRVLLNLCDAVCRQVLLEQLEIPDGVEQLFHVVAADLEDHLLQIWKLEHASAALFIPFPVKAKLIQHVRDALPVLFVVNEVFDVDDKNLNAANAFGILVIVV